MKKTRGKLLSILMENNIRNNVASTGKVSVLRRCRRKVQQSYFPQKVTMKKLKRKQSQQSGTKQMLKFISLEMPKMHYIIC